jgi:transaldolase
MVGTYFARVAERYPTRMWVNNPTLEEISLALQQGAFGCTTNPGYGGNLVKRAPDEVRPILAECLSLSDDDEQVAELVQYRLVARIAKHFLSLYEATGGKMGFVSIQGAPEADTDGDHITEEARVARTLGPNVTPKIPATAPGFAAMEAMLEAGSQLIVTEVFSLAQLIHTCEIYERVTTRTGVRPPFFISPITGIFGDYLKKLKAMNGIAVPDAAIDLVGVALTRLCHKVVVERGYAPILLAGGARTMVDFTGLVGGNVHATINWSTAAEIIAADPPVAATLSDPIDPAILDALGEFVDVRKAFSEDGLVLEEFEGFGPVQHFRDRFIEGWLAVLEMVRTERKTEGAD